LHLFLDGDAVISQMLSPHIQIICSDAQSEMAWSFPASTESHTASQRQTANGPDGRLLLPQRRPAKESLDQAIDLMSVWAPEYSRVGDDANQFDWRLAASFAEFVLVSFRAALVLAHVFFGHRLATFGTVHG
jgi:hypothetical protein